MRARLRQCWFPRVSCLGKAVSVFFGVCGNVSDQSQHKTLSRWGVLVCDPAVDCSDQGVCRTDGYCLCVPGYSGTDCATGTLCSLCPANVFVFSRWQKPLECVLAPRLEMIGQGMSDAGLAGAIIGTPLCRRAFVACLLFFQGSTHTPKCHPGLPPREMSRLDVGGGEMRRSNALFLSRVPLG